MALELKNRNSDQEGLTIFMKPRNVLSVICCFYALTNITHADNHSSGSGSALVSSQATEKKHGVLDANRWTFQFGVAMITDNTIDDFLTLDISRASGAAGGEMCLFSASYTLYHFDWMIGNYRCRPQLELPLVIGVVDENGRTPFFDYNAGVTIRWKDFPFNNFVYMNIESGVGLSYSEHVLQVEKDRHPNRDRSHLKFYWPIQIMLAHPEHREHQLAAFIHHQSGGHIFDIGGSNLVGLGYRYVFGER